MFVLVLYSWLWFFFFFNDTATTEIYTLSLHDALPICSGKQVVRSEEAYQAEFGERRATIAAAGLAAIQADPIAMASARSVFDRNCAVCHGYEAQGQANYFPSLIDDDWDWGESPAQIEQSIRAGRSAVMVPWGTVLGEQGVANVASYVLELSDGAAKEHPGKTQYEQFCGACHGPTGDGNPVFGAPRLNDDIWLYGGSVDAVTESISNGRTGEMPAFGGRLDDVQIRLLVALLTASIDPDLLVE